jgi:hypothetical protein
MKLSYAIFLLLIPIVIADIGPKPTADIHVTLDGMDVPDPFFAAKMLTCQYQMKYEPIVRELAPYEQSYDWHDRCREAAPRYGLDPKLCYGELQNQRGMGNMTGRVKCKDEMCERLLQTIPDPDRGCYWTVAPMAWGGNCSQSSCRFNYFLPKSFRLSVYLPSQDRIYMSDEVTRRNFRSAFEAELLNDGGMILSETTPFRQSDTASHIRTFLIALGITLLLELLVALLYCYLAKVSRTVLISVLIANLISLPIVWFVFTLLDEYFLVIFLAELFAVVFEAYFIAWRGLTLRKAFILSILMNAASFVIGGGITLFIFLRGW